MKNLFIALLTLIILSSCNEGKKGNMTVIGNVEGLKVGKLYLQQLQDTTLVNIDSVIIDGENSFKMSATIDDPQLMYLYLDKKDKTIYNDRISFFAEDTVITINTSLEKFETAAIIKGSKNQELYNEFNKVKAQLSEKYTDLFKRSLRLSQAEVKNQDSIDILSKDINKHIKRKVGYAINFATLHKEQEISPFILIQEGAEANPVFLDSAYNMMPKKIQNSRYGKQLSEFIKNKKEEL